MPVEIRELVIRAVASMNAPEDKRTVQPSPPDNETIIQECVRQVLNIIKKKEER